MVDRKNILIVSLLIVVSFMTVGYALMAAELEQSNNIINKENSKWNVEITEISNIEVKGYAENISNEIENSSSAKFNIKLADKDAQLVYTIKVTNKGTMDAILKSFTINHSMEEYVVHSVEGISINDTLKVGETKSFTITVKLNEEIDNIKEITEKFTVILDYKSI